MVEENVEQEKSCPEGGHGHTGHTEEAADMVPETVPPNRGENSERDSHPDGNKETRQGQFKGSRDSLDEIFENRTPCRRALSEISTKQTGQIPPVLDINRLVKAHLLFHEGQVFGRGKGAGLDHGRIAGEEIGEGKRDDGDPQKGRDHHHQPFHNITTKSHSNRPRSFLFIEGP